MNIKLWCVIVNVNCTVALGFCVSPFHYCLLLWAWLLAVVAVLVEILSFSVSLSFMIWIVWMQLCSSVICAMAAIECPGPVCTVYVQYLTKETYWQRDIHFAQNSYEILYRKHAVISSAWSRNINSLGPKADLSAYVLNCITWRWQIYPHFN